MHFFHVLNESSNHEDEVKVYRDIRKRLESYVYHNEQTMLAKFFIFKTSRTFDVESFMIKNFHLNYM